MHILVDILLELLDSNVDKEKDNLHSIDTMIMSLMQKLSFATDKHDTVHDCYIKVS